MAVPGMYLESARKCCAALPENADHREMQFAHAECLRQSDSSRKQELRRDRFYGNQANLSPRTQIVLAKVISAKYFKIADLLKTFRDAHQIDRVFPCR